MSSGIISSEMLGKVLKRPQEEEDLVCAKKAKQFDEKYPEMRYYLNEELSDVWFVVNGVKIPANKTFLSVKSEVFGAQFSGDFKDSEAKEIVVEEITVEAFGDMLRFLHKEDLVLSDDQSIDLAKDVYLLADKYKLFRFMDLMDKHFVKLMNEATLKEISRFAHEFNFKNLSEKCKHYLKNNLNEWMDMKIDDLLDINLNTDNIIFKIIIKKHRQTKEIFSKIIHNSYNEVMLKKEISFKYLKDLGVWKYEIKLHDAIGFDFNRI